MLQPHSSRTNITDEMYYPKLIKISQISASAVIRSCNNSEIDPIVKRKLLEMMDMSSLITSGIREVTLAIQLLQSK